MCSCVRACVYVYVCVWGLGVGGADARMSAVLLPSAGYGLLVLYLVIYLLQFLTQTPAVVPGMWILIFFNLYSV